MSEFYTVRDRKASAKKRICAECKTAIDIGDPYRSCSGRDDGEFWTMDVHADCQIWASDVIYDCGDGRGLLADEDPADDLEPADLIARIRACPPPDAVRKRLPLRWRRFVDLALADKP